MSNMIEEKLRYCNGSIELSACIEHLLVDWGQVVLTYSLDDDVNIWEDTYEKTFAVCIDRKERNGCEEIFTSYFSVEYVKIKMDYRT